LLTLAICAKIRANTTLETKMKKYILFVLILLQSVALQIVHADSSIPHPAGTNITASGIVYFLDGSSRRPYTSAGAFSSYGFNTWSGLQIANASDLNLPSGNFVPPMDGSLINDHGTVWVISKGQKWGFTNSNAFNGLGYSWSNVITGDASFLPTGGNISLAAQAHPIDTVINDNGTDYLITSKGKVGIPSQVVFASWGYSDAKVVTANSFDLNSNLAVLSPALPIRPATQLSAGTYYITSIYQQQSNPVSNPIVSTAPANPTNPTTLASPIPNNSLKQCGTSASCLTQSAQSCTLAEGTIALQNIQDTSLIVNATFDVQLLGEKNGSCSYQVTITSANVLGFTQAYQQQQLADGATQQDITASLPDAQALIQMALNIPSQCSQSDAILTAMIQRWQQDIYADSDASSCSNYTGS
jgi:hypothetical protein